MNEPADREVVTSEEFHIGMIVVSGGFLLTNIAVITGDTWFHFIVIFAFLFSLSISIYRVLRGRIC